MCREWKELKGICVIIQPLWSASSIKSLLQRFWPFCSARQEMPNNRTVATVVYSNIKESAFLFMGYMCALDNLELDQTERVDANKKSCMKHLERESCNIFIGTSNPNFRKGFCISVICTEKGLKSSRILNISSLQICFWASFLLQHEFII